MSTIKNGKIIISGSFDMTIKIWYKRTGKLIKLLRPHNNLIRALDVSLDGNTIISGGDDCMITI